VQWTAEHRFDQTDRNYEDVIATILYVHMGVNHGGTAGRVPLKFGVHHFWQDHGQQIPLRIHAI